MKHIILSLTVCRGDAVERMTWGLATRLMLEPMRVQVKDPWQRKMAARKTARLELDVHRTSLDAQRKESASCA